MRLPILPLLGLASATSATLGALCVFAAPALPPGWLSLATLCVGVVAMAFAPRARPLAAFALGLSWTALQGTLAMDARLPAALAGDQRVEFRVEGLPRGEGRSTRFDARILDGPLRGRRARLGWYEHPPPLEPGSRWSATLRLKRPRGTVNPGGFDFERHALERGLAATGYVRASPAPRRLAAGAGIDRLRSGLSARIGEAVGERSPDAAKPASPARFVQALAVGDTRELTEHDWEVLRATGITHLIAISGLHVGLVAGFGALLMRLAHRLVPRLGLRVPMPRSAAAAALACAAAYTALAGFALPTVRTLLMIAAALAGVLLRRATSGAQAFALSLAAVLAVDPLALLGAGFWLSYVGVAWLLWCLPREGAVSPLRSLLSAQAVMTVSLLPLGVWFFGQASLAGPVANLVAVPWVSFVVVPVTLAGTACELLHAGAGRVMFRLAAWLMERLWVPLERVAEWRGAIAWLPEPTPVGLAFALFGAFWLLLPRGVPGKPLALFLFLPLLWPATRPIAPGEVEVTLLDVGQGLALLLRTRTHALVYDAGPAPADGLDQGQTTVVPALRALGVGRLDAFVESHGHNDHAGGTAALLRAYAPARVHASDPARGASPCEGAWAWDGVAFEFLHPPTGFPYLENDSSCVLRVATRGGALLLPGDISAQIEARLGQAHDLAARVVVVPHHGSRSASSPAFVAATGAAVALVGSGHGNRFGLPRPDIVQRWRAAGARVFDTADHGAVTLRLGAEGLDGPRARRQTHPRWWRED